VGWELWVLVAASLLALQLFGILLKREQRDQLPYAGLMLLCLGLLCLAHATGHDGALVGKVGVSLALVMVLVPRWLESLERRALSRDDLRLALRIAGARELVQPGRAAMRRRRQLANLVEARAGNSADVVRRLERELAAERDAHTAAMLHEELATTLFLAQRFSDGVAVAERNLPRPWAGQHPAFGAFLVRAYGEIDRVDAAAETLRALEGGPAARDPGAVVLLTQARLTLLAFAGRAADVDRLLASEAGLLVSSRARQMLHDTARDRAAQARDVPAELTQFLDGVVARAAENARPLVRERRTAHVTFALIAVNAAVWLLSSKLSLKLEAHPSGADLIRWGALFRPAVHAGEWWRAACAMFLHGNWEHIALNLYALFILGRFAEEVLGHLRYFVVYVAGGACGALGSVYATSQVGLSVGASGAIMGLLGAIIVVLLLRRGAWPEAWRRTLLWNLAFLAALQIWIGFQLPMIDNAAHVCGTLGGGAMALVVAPGGLLGRSRAGRGLVVVLACAMLAALAWSAARAAVTPLDASLRKIPTRDMTLDGVTYTVPNYFERDDEAHALVDPYLELTFAPGRPVDHDDPRLDAFIARIEKSARRP
jgi:membrane associated rhomboid family serine protease